MPMFDEQIRIAIVGMLAITAFFSRGRSAL
jgi:hypothetical protein